jgi:hypothetical protein
MDRQIDLYARGSNETKIVQSKEAASDNDTTTGRRYRRTLMQELLNICLKSPLSVQLFWLLPVTCYCMRPVVTLSAIICLNLKWEGLLITDKDGCNGCVCHIATVSVHSAN